jgi:hypothetical protein
VPLPLHPLARQAIIASADPACGRWAIGMTKYLAHDDPCGCVHWAFNLAKPFIDASGEHGCIISRGCECLLTSLENPQSGNLEEMESLGWEAWHHRFVTRGGNPLARLIWAAMGAVESLNPGKLASISNSQLFPRCSDRAEIAKGIKALAWEQSAMAIEVMAADHKEIPLIAAQAFTTSVAIADGPESFSVKSRFEWNWQDISYEIAVLEASSGFYIEFTDRIVCERLYSGPFLNKTDVNDHIQLLRHQPRRIKIVQISPDAH